MIDRPHPQVVSRRSVPALVAVLALAASLASAQPPAVASESPPWGGAEVVASYHRALATVERAVRALGGEAGPAGLEAIVLTLEATAMAPYQSLAPAPPYMELPVVIAIEVAPLAPDGSRRARVESETRFPDFRARQVRVLGPAGAAEVDPDSGAASPGRFAWEDLDRELRRSPHLVVRDAWERRGELRWLGRAAEDGPPVDLVAFPFLGTRQLTLAIDAEGRLLWHAFLFDDPRTGDASVVAEFLDYRREEGRWLPGRFRQWEAGLPAVEGRYSRYVVGEAPPAERFAATPAPADEASANGGAAAPAPGASRARSTELAPGVHLVSRLRGLEYNSLIVDLGESFAVVEAPLGPAVADEIVAAAAEIDPQKPIRYVVATHFHDDHSGGVPHLVAATGATVVTTPGAAELFREATAARRTLSDPALDPEGPAAILVVEGERELPGEQPLRLLDIGPTGHATEMLVAWLPEASLLFQGDLIRFPDEGPVEPAREQAHRLAAVLAERGIEPEWIAGVHGRTGTMAELREALAASRR